MSSLANENDQPSAIAVADDLGPQSANAEVLQKPDADHVPSAALDIEHATVADDPRKWSHTRKVRTRSPLSYPLLI